MKGPQRTDWRTKLDSIIIIGLGYSNIRRRGFFEMDEFAIFPCNTRKSMIR